MARCESEYKITRQISKNGSILTQIENPAAFTPLIRILPQIIQTENIEITFRGCGLKITVPEDTLAGIRKDLPPETRIRALNILLKMARNAKTFGVKEKSSTCLY